MSDILTAFILGLSCGVCLAAWLARTGRLPGAFSSDKVEGLEADLENAVETAFNRGAKDWARMNYPDQYQRLSLGEVD